MSGAIPPLSQYVFVVWCLVKHRDNFIFTIYWKDKTKDIKKTKGRKIRNKERKKK
jgi:hypothetical protein